MMKNPFLGSQLAQSGKHVTLDLGGCGFKSHVDSSNYLNKYLKRQIHSLPYPQGSFTKTPNCSTVFCLLEYNYKLTVLVKWMWRSSSITKWAFSTLVLTLTCSIYELGRYQASQSIYLVHFVCLLCARHCKVL